MRVLRSDRFAGDPLLEACAIGGATLGAGCAGSAVAKVQQALMDLCYVLGDFGPDGVFGEETAEAVARFAADVGLGADAGMMGSSVVRALDERFAGEEPRRRVGTRDRALRSPRAPGTSAAVGAGEVAAIVGRAVDAALDQVAAGAHYLAGAAGATPGGGEGTQSRPGGVGLTAGRTDPSHPAVFAAWSDADGGVVCAGRFNAGNGGIAGGRPAACTDTDLIVYLAGLASKPESEWKPFFRFFSPRRVAAGPPSAQVVWGEDCRAKQHFDGEGLVNWCLEQATGGRWPIAFDLATWATEGTATEAVALAEAPCKGDIVVRAVDGRFTHIGFLIADGDAVVPEDHGHVVLAEQDGVGVVRRRFSPAGWTVRRRVTPALLPQ